MRAFVYVAMVIGSGLAAGCLEGPHGPVIGEVSGAFARAEERATTLDEREGEDPCAGQTWPDYSDDCIKEITAKVCEAAGGTNCRDEDEAEVEVGGADELATVSREAGLFCTLCEAQGCKCYVWKQECYCPGLTSEQATDNARHVIGLSTGDEAASPSRSSGDDDDDILYDPEDDLLPPPKPVGDDSPTVITR